MMLLQRSKSRKSSFPTVEEKGRLKMLEAVVRSVSVSAGKGNFRAQKVFIDYRNEAERYNQSIKVTLYENAFNYKICWEAALKRRKREGIVAPDPIPHPDDIQLDYMTGHVHCTGPFTADEAKTMAKVCEMLLEIEQKIVDGELRLREDLNEGERRAVRREINRNIKRRALLEKRSRGLMGVTLSAKLARGIGKIREVMNEE